jgi:hypothetical protein
LPEINTHFSATMYNTILLPIMKHTQCSTTCQ